VFHLVAIFILLLTNFVKICYNLRRPSLGGELNFLQNIDININVLKFARFIGN